MYIMTCYQLYKVSFCYWNCCGPHRVFFVILSLKVDTLLVCDLNTDFTPLIPCSHRHFVCLEEWHEWNCNAVFGCYISDLVLVQRALAGIQNGGFGWKVLGSSSFLLYWAVTKPVFCRVINSIFPCALFTVIGFVEIRMPSVHNVGHVLFVTI